MDTFRIQYRDVHADRHPAVEIIPAVDTTSAMTEFTRRRRSEHWTRMEILIESVVLIINETTGEHFVIDNQGALASYQPQAR